jgi:hypothetical protein
VIEIAEAIKPYRFDADLGLGAAMYLFRALSILCMASALIAMFFMVGDKINGIEFRQGWLQFSSLFWMIVFGAVSA